MAGRRPAVDSATVEVVARGPVSDTAVDYARSKVEHVTRYTKFPVLSARAVLTQSADPGVQRPARAEASLDVSGTQIRAHSVATDMLGAVDLVEQRLKENLLQHQDRVRTRHRWIGVAGKHQWRHGDLATQREGFFPRAPQERRIVRRKTFALAPMTVDEAAYEMSLLGHDFYLFTDRRSGKDAVVYRDGTGRFAVRGEAVVEGQSEPLVQRAGSAPELTEAEAVERLGLSGERFVFYLDPQTRRGRVLYMRYDGHYGLVTAATA